MGGRPPAQTGATNANGANNIPAPTHGQAVAWEFKIDANTKIGAAGLAAQTPSPLAKQALLLIAKGKRNVIPFDGALEALMDDQRSPISWADEDLVTMWNLDFHDNLVGNVGIAVLAPLVRTICMEALATTALQRMSDAVEKIKFKAIEEQNRKNEWKAQCTKMREVTTAWMAYGNAKADKTTQLEAEIEKLTLRAARSPVAPQGAIDGAQRAEGELNLQLDLSRPPPLLNMPPVTVQTNGASRNQYASGQRNVALPSNAAGTVSYTDGVLRPSVQTTRPSLPAQLSTLNNAPSYGDARFLQSTNALGGATGAAT